MSTSEIRSYPLHVATEAGDIEFRMMGPADEAAVLEFAQKLPVHDLLFLPRNISEPKVLAAWIKEIERGSIISLLAVKSGRVVGCGTIVRDPLSWSPHVGEIRNVVSPDVRGQGVGRALSQETFALALSIGLEKLLVQMTVDQTGAIAIFEGLGFKAEALLHDHVCDLTGSTILSCSRITWRRSGPRWKPMGCPTRWSTRPKMYEQAVIGLIGGMSWESSAEYYRIINREVRNRLGGVHSARSLMWSVDFGEIERLQHQGDWEELTKRMKDAAIRLESGGADFVLMCTNTMHLMADAVAAAIDIPLLHIADPTAEKIKAAGFRKVGLLGTAFTMERDFYKGRLEQVFGLDVLVPDASDRGVVHDIIYKELVAGEVRPESRVAYREVIARLSARGAQAIILGCTEIMLLVSEEDSAVPLFDTTTIHAIAAVDRALAGWSPSKMSAG